jgi:hypothetical protein
MGQAELKNHNSSNARENEPSFSKIKLCCVLSGWVLFMFVAIFMIVLGVWQHPLGQSMMMKFTLEQRGKLVTIPMVERGVLWKLRELFQSFFLEAGFCKHFVWYN